MKLDAITVAMINRAIDLYVKVAYSGLPPKVFPPDFGIRVGESIENYLHCFESESNREAGVMLRRYVLRLGNRRYPFMKFVMQEHLIQDEFIFLVDTHDDMFNIPSSEFDDLRKIREFNQEIKRQIEALWTQAQVPTAASLKDLVTFPEPGRDKEEVREFENKTILVVDDDLEMGDTLEALLTSKGFKVERLFDGVDAVREADPLLHDMIIMDNDMKIMDGQEACRILKADPKRSTIPIMISSARNVDFSVIDQADAYLIKPFHQNVLFSFLRHILKVT